MARRSASRVPASADAGRTRKAENHRQNSAISVTITRPMPGDNSNSNGVGR